jgi:hypothetical protein
MIRAPVQKPSVLTASNGSIAGARPVGCSKESAAAPGGGFYIFSGVDPPPGKGRGNRVISPHVIPR